MNQPAPYTDAINADTLASVLLDGNLAKLTNAQRVEYMLGVCKTLGLNPATKPFEFITLNGKLTMYAKRDCTEQLRKVHAVSITIKAREVVNGCYVVTAAAVDKTGRCDESIGAVPIDGLKGENLSNAMMKTETKAKRRVTLSICGLGLLDETEVASIPGVMETATITEAVKASNPDASQNQINAALVKEGVDPVINLDEKTKAQELFKELKMLGAKTLKIAQAIKHSCGTDYKLMAMQLSTAIHEEMDQDAKEPEPTEPNF